MNREVMTMFGIETIRDYLIFCNQAVSELEQDQGNVLRGFTAILALNHVSDWLQYKLTYAQRQTLGIESLKRGDPVKDYFERQNGDLRLIRDLANGFKHLRTAHSTDTIAGFGLGPFGIGPFGVPYLLIDLGQSLPPNERWDVGLDLCKRALGWWLQTLSPLGEISQGAENEGH
jgi:hypothetical protein